MKTDSLTINGLLYNGVTGAELKSVKLKGKSTSTTPSKGDNSERIATTEFVSDALKDVEASLNDGVLSTIEETVEEIKQEINKLEPYTYKGSCHYNELSMVSNKVGDVWNVLDEHDGVPAGTNYAWTGSEWDALGGIIDIKDLNRKDLDAIFKKKSYVWNQLIKNYLDLSNWKHVGYNGSDFSGDITISNTDNALSFTGGYAEYTGSLDMIKPNHKYLFKMDIRQANGANQHEQRICYINFLSSESILVRPTSQNWDSVKTIKTAGTGDKLYIRVTCSSLSDITNLVKNVQLIDLTLLYGEGNEPSTVDQFEEDCRTLFNKSTEYENYDSGSVILMDSDNDNNVSEGKFVSGENLNDIWSNIIEPSIENKQDALPKGNTGQVLTKTEDSVEWKDIDVEGPINELKEYVDKQDTSISNSLNQKITEETNRAKKAEEEISKNTQNTISELEKNIEDTYAKQEGHYEGLTSGLADNLSGFFDDKNTSAYRTTAGDNDIESDIAEIQSIQGNSIAWNQLYYKLNDSISNSATNVEITLNEYDINLKSDGTQSKADKLYFHGISAIPNHKYLVRCASIKNISDDIELIAYATNDNIDGSLLNSSYKSIDFNTIYTTTNTQITITFGYIVKNIDKEVNVTYQGLNVFDLTLIYGAGNEPTTPEQFEADYQRWFGKPLEYEEYDEGSIRSVKATGIKTVGFNLYSGGDILENNNWKTYVLFNNDCLYKGKIECSLEIYNIENSISAGYINILYVDGTSKLKFPINTGKGIVVTEENKIVKEIFVEVLRLNIKNICVHFSWSGRRDGEYEPYWEETKPIPIIDLMGKLNGEGESVTIFPDGLKRAGDVYDEILTENGVTKAIKRVGSVDLGTLSYTKSINYTNRFYSSRESPFKYGTTNLFCSKKYGVFTNQIGIGVYIGNSRNNPLINIVNDYFIDKTNEEVKDSLNGIILYCELEEPEVYILDNFELPLNYKVDDFGTEQILGPEDSIAPIITTRYGINAVDTLRRLNDRFVQIKDLNGYLNTKQDKLPEGEIGQILTKTIEGPKWEYLNLPIDLVSYGVEWDINVSNPACTRIGNPLLHKSLPIQSKMRGCVAKGKEIQYYLDPNDWSKKLDGTDSVLDGTDGSVMVHIPRFYGRSFIDGDKRSVRISETRIDSTWIEIPEMLVSAYHPTVDNTDASNPKLVSVINTNPSFRGGSNSVTYDQYLETDKFRTLLGKGRTSISRANARKYARNADVELLSYEQYKWVFYWLFVIEYATFNSQAAYNAELTSDGYHQGGLGSAVTTGNRTYWNMFNGQNPVIPNGFTNSIGNFTGIVNTGDIKFLYNGDTTLGIDSFTIATAACVATKDAASHSMTITNVLQANTNMLTHDLQHMLGHVKYRVEGLQEGQSLLFFIDSTQVDSIDEDGDVTVHWDTTNLGTRAIRADFTGECNITISSEWESTENVELTVGNFDVPRYRGIEQPFGDIWTNLDGIIIDSDCGETGRNDNLDIVHTTNNPESYGETITDEYHIAGLALHQDGNIKHFDLGDTAEIIPSAVGSGSTTYKCDHRYAGNKNNTLRTLLVGGRVTSGALAGVGCFYSNDGLAATAAYFGFCSSVIL